MPNEIIEQRDKQWVELIMKRRQRALESLDKETEPLVSASFRGEIIGYDSLLFHLNANTFPYGQRKYR